jgi:hypothetical protein
MGVHVADGDGAWLVVRQAFDSATVIRVNPAPSPFSCVRFER